MWGFMGPLLRTFFTVTFMPIDSRNLVHVIFCVSVHQMDCLHVYDQLALDSHDVLHGHVHYQPMFSADPGD